MNAIEKTINCGTIYIELGSFDVSTIKYGEDNPTIDCSSFLGLFFNERNQVYLLNGDEMEGELANLFKKYFNERLE